jgi:hypothetical protein
MAAVILSVVRRSHVVLFNILGHELVCVVSLAHVYCSVNAWRSTFQQPLGGW